MAQLLPGPLLGAGLAPGRSPTQVRPFGRALGRSCSWSVVLLVGPVWPRPTMMWVGGATREAGVPGPAGQDGAQIGTATSGMGSVG